MMYFSSTLLLRNGKSEIGGKRMSETREATTAANALPTLRLGCQNEGKSVLARSSTYTRPTATSRTLSLKAKSAARLERSERLDSQRPRTFEATPGGLDVSNDEYFRWSAPDCITHNDENDWSWSRFH
jgi:hypothetical protein